MNTARARPVSTYATRSTCGSDGEWTAPLVSKTLSDHGEDHWSYSGSGTIIGEHEGDMTGQEDGRDDRSWDYDATWTQEDDGIWSTSGSGKAETEWESHFSYSGGYCNNSYPPNFTQMSAGGEGGRHSRHVEYWTPVGSDWLETGATDFTQSVRDEDYHLTSETHNSEETIDCDWHWECIEEATSTWTTRRESVVESPEDSGLVTRISHGVHNYHRDYDEFTWPQGPIDNYDEFGYGTGCVEQWFYDDEEYPTRASIR